MTKEKRSIAITSVLIKIAIVLCAAALFLMPYAAKCMSRYRSSEIT